MKYFIKRWESNNNQQKLQQLKNEISLKYINKDLIKFFEELNSSVFKREEKIFYLEFCRKIVQQYPRKPDEHHYEAFKAEYDLYFDEIKEQQNMYNPLIWLDAELSYLRFLHQYANQSDELELNTDKEWLTIPEMQKWLGISKADLNRKVASGMPKTKIGRHVRFAPEKVRDWIANQNN